MLCIVAGNRRKLLKFLSVQSVSYVEFAPKFLSQFMLKLVKLELLDVLSTSTTVSRVFTVSLNKDFDVCMQKCRPYVSGLLQDTLTGLKHPQTVSILFLFF